MGAREDEVELAPLLRSAADGCGRDDHEQSEQERVKPEAAPLKVTAELIDALRLAEEDLCEGEATRLHLLGQFLPGFCGRVLVAPV